MTHFKLSGRAQREIAYLYAQSDRMDSILTGLQQQLDGRAHVYDEIPNEEGLRCAEARPFPNVPPLRVWYLYDEAADEVKVKLFVFDGQLIPLADGNA